MGEKVTVMVLKVNDLQCPCCYRKVKKVLCKFPQIGDQIYDEKANTVTITVVCCDPEKIRDKICCKGCGVIKSIEIKQPKKPEKPKPPEKPKEPEKPKPKSPEKPKVVIIEEPKPKAPEKPPPVVVIEKPKEPEKPKEVPKPDPPKPPLPKPHPPPPVMPHPPPFDPCPHPPPPVMPHPPPFDPCPPNIPVRTCCRECYEGHGGGPCYYGHGFPPPPPPCYDGYYGYGCRCGCGYGYGRRCDVSRCDQYFSDDNPQSCHVM